MDSFGYGQQTPNDSASDFNGISFLIRQIIGRLDTMKLVEVKAVNSDGEIAAAGTVDVLPLVNQIDGAGNATSHGIVHGLPWTRLQGGTCAVICDPVVGDIGYVIASDRDISNVKASKQRSNPGSFRKFNIADGIYIGGALNVAPEQYLVFTATGIRLVDKSGNVISMSADGIALTPATGKPITLMGDAIVRGNLLLQGILQGQTGGVYAGNIQTSASFIAGTDVSVGGVTLKTHIHPQAPDSHGDTEQPTGAPQGP